MGLVSSQLRLVLLLVMSMLFVRPFLTAQVPAQNHVIVIAFENHSYEDVVGNPDMPYFNNTFLPNAALATNFYSNLHGSLANYFWITMGTSLCGTSGPPYGSDPNCADGTLVTADKDNLVRQLLASGKTWKAYQEGMANQGRSPKERHLVSPAAQERTMFRGTIPRFIFPTCVKEYLQTQLVPPIPARSSLVPMALFKAATSFHIHRTSRQT